MHHRFARFAKNVAIGSESVSESLKLAIPRRSQELRLSYDTLWHISDLDIHLHPYKV